MDQQRYCQDCGAGNRTDARFCQSCGVPLGGRKGKLAIAAPDYGDAPIAADAVIMSLPKLTAPSVPSAESTAAARQAAAGRSYTTPALITLALYFAFWLPGLVANLIYLNAANEDRRNSGVAPQGRGCLVGLMVLFIALPAGLLALNMGLSALLGAAR